MKKTIYLLSLALTVLLTACSVDNDTESFIKEEDNAERTLFYRLYVEPYVGQWNLTSYYTITRTNVLASDGIVCDEINGVNSQEMKGTWTFQSDGWGTISLQEGYSCPLLDHGSAYEFQWYPTEETGVLHLTLYYTENKTTSEITFDAIPEWPNYASDIANAQSYDADRFSLIIHYQTNGVYAELDDLYPEYTQNNNRYDSMGCTFIQYVMLYLSFERK